MKDFLLGLLVMALCATVVGLSIWWWSFKYSDCLAVGHNVTYCTIDLLN